MAASAALVLLTEARERARQICHPDVASDASGRNWLLASGQLRASEAGTGFEIAKRSLLMPSRVLL
jgi:hypothetical protein